MSSNDGFVSYWNSRDVVNWKCFICGEEDEAGLGYWACHADEDETRVHTGKCWREYSKAKTELKALGVWEMLCPEIDGCR